jgi:hypothetical protein
MNKTTKRILIGAGILAVIGGGTWFAVSRLKGGSSTASKPLSSLTDKNNNVFKLSTEQDSYGNYKVLINGKHDGEVITLNKGTDGYIYGTNTHGKIYKYTTKWNLVTSIAGLGNVDSILLN